MSKDYEYLPATGEAWVYLSMIRVTVAAEIRVKAATGSVAGEST